MAMILKRNVLRRDYGIAIFSEGLVDVMDEKEVKELFGSVGSGHHELGQLLAKRTEV